MPEIIFNLPPESALALWTAILSVLVPLLVSIAKQHNWSAGAKSACALILSAVGAVLVLYGTGRLEGPIDVVALGLLIFAMGRQVYEGIYDKFGIDALFNPYKKAEAAAPTDTPPAS